MKRPVSRDGVRLIDARGNWIGGVHRSGFPHSASVAHLDEIAACVNILPELIPAMEEALDAIMGWCCAFPDQADSRDVSVINQLNAGIEFARGCVSND